MLAVVGITAALVWGLGRLCVAYRGARMPLLLVVIGVGGVAGYVVLRTSSGYLAGLVWEQAVFMVLLVAVVSVVFAAIPRTRRYGVIGVIGLRACLRASSRCTWAATTWASMRGRTIGRFRFNNRW